MPQEKVAPDGIATLAPKTGLGIVTPCGLEN